MGKQHEAITPAIAEWIENQKMFFVATAPLAGEGLVNCSPKGMDTFRILGPREVAYLDLTGSGVETVAHLRENGRIVIMFCAFDHPPRIVRLHGTGEVVTRASPEFETLLREFPAHRGERAIIRARVTRVSDSCGFAVPRYDYRGERGTLARWADAKGPEALVAYRKQKNARSIDGLPALEPADR